MNRSKLEDEVHLADHAVELMQNPAFKAAMIRSKGEVFEAWTGTKWYERKERKDLWRRQKAIEAFEKHLELILGDGKLAAQDLKNLQKRGK